MSKSIASYGDGFTKLVVVKRRLAQSEMNRGLGYWGAVDAKERINKEKKSEPKGDGENG